jgi:NADPH2 dehydrogenase
MKSINRWTPLNLGRGITLKNRVVVPAMASGTALPSGKATAATCAHYERLATSGAGLIIVEYSFVSMSGRSEENVADAIRDLIRCKMSFLKCTPCGTFDS